MQIGWKSTFTVARKRDALMGGISMGKTVSETCRALGIAKTTFARCREQLLEGVDAALANTSYRISREDVFAKQLA